MTSQPPGDDAPNTGGPEVPPRRDRWDSPGANFLRQNFVDPMRPNQKLGFFAAALSIVVRMFGDNDPVPALPPASPGVRWLRIAIGVAVTLLIIVAVIARLLR